MDKMRVLKHYAFQEVTADLLNSIATSLFAMSDGMAQAFIAGFTNDDDLIFQDLIVTPDVGLAVKCGLQGVFLYRVDQQNCLVGVYKGYRPDKLTPYTEEVITLDPAHATLDRVDIIEAEIVDEDDPDYYDSVQMFNNMTETSYAALQYIRRVRNVKLYKKTGIAAVNPVAPVATVGRFTLREINVAAAAVSLVGGDIVAQTPDPALSTWTLDHGVIHFPSIYEVLEFVKVKFAEKRYIRFDVPATYIVNVPKYVTKMNVRAAGGGGGGAGITTNQALNPERAGLPGGDTLIGSVVIEGGYGGGLSRRDIGGRSRNFSTDGEQGTATAGGKGGGVYGGYGKRRTALTEEIGSITGYRLSNVALGSTLGLGHGYRRIIISGNHPNGALTEFLCYSKNQSSIAIKSGGSIRPIAKFPVNTGFQRVLQINESAINTYLGLMDVRGLAIYASGPWQIYGFPVVSSGEYNSALLPNSKQDYPSRYNAILTSPSDPGVSVEESVFGFKGGSPCIFYVDGLVPNQIKVWNIQANTITVYAGAGTAGDVVDPNPLNARFNSIRGLAYANDKLYISDYGNHKIKVVDTLTDAVTLFAGTGNNATTDNANPLLADIATPSRMTIAETPSGNHLCFIAASNQAIRSISLNTNAVYTNTQYAPLMVDGDTSTVGRVTEVTDISVDNLYTDTINKRFYFIDNGCLRWMTAPENGNPAEIYTIIGDVGDQYNRSLQTTVDGKFGGGGCGGTPESGGQFGGGGGGGSYWEGEIDVTPETALSITVGRGGRGGVGIVGFYGREALGDGGNGGDGFVELSW